MQIFKMVPKKKVKYGPTDTFFMNGRSTYQFTPCLTR